MLMPPCRRRFFIDYFHFIISPMPYLKIAFDDDASDYCRLADTITLYSLRRFFFFSPYCFRYAALRYFRRLMPPYLHYHDTHALAAQRMRRVCATRDGSAEARCEARAQRCEGARFRHRSVRAQRVCAEVYARAVAYASAPRYARSAIAVHAMRVTYDAFTL